MFIFPSLDGSPRDLDDVSSFERSKSFSFPIKLAQKGPLWTALSNVRATIKTKKAPRNETLIAWTEFH